MQNQRLLIIGISIGLLSSFLIKRFIKYVSKHLKNVKTYEDHPITMNLDTDLLKKTNLCQLSCSDDENCHNSLMAFTYLPEDIIILTSRKDTKKYRLIKKNPNVSILFHQFSQTDKNEP